MAVFVADEQGRPVDVGRLHRLATFVAASQDVPADMELSVFCVDPVVMAELNAAHMGADGATDVLAFPIDLPGEALADEPAVLGDVVLCPQVAADQAVAHGSTPEAELDLLLVHGILHLLGHDHAEEDERHRMFALTEELLERFRAERAVS